jgi:hypothetical protein
MQKIIPLYVPVGSTNNAPNPPPRRMEQTNRHGRFHDLSGIGPQKQSKLTVLQYRHDMAAELCGLTVELSGAAAVARALHFIYHASAPAIC